MEKRNVVEEGRTPEVSLKKDPPAKTPSQDPLKKESGKPEPTNIQNVEEIKRMHS